MKKIANISVLGLSILALASCNKEEEVKHDTVEYKMESIGHSLNEGENTIKDESVYSICDNEGKHEKTIVTDWLKTDGKEKVEDLSNLKNIENIKGEETYSKDGNKVSWAANKNDIIYQGEYDGNLPISISIKYNLDGSDIKPSDLKGKSGHLKIGFKYNSESVNLNGMDIYYPFGGISTLVFENDHAKNIHINNGKVISDGNKNIVLGYGISGVYETFNTNKKDSDTFDIEMDVVDFTYSGAVSVFMNSFDMEKGFIDNLKTGEEAYSKIKGFVNNEDLYKQEYQNVLKLLTNDLTNGLNDLYNGLLQINGYIHQLADVSEKAFNALDSIKNALNISVENEKKTLAYLESDYVKASLCKDQDSINQYKEALTSLITSIKYTEGVLEKLNHSQNNDSFYDALYALTNLKTLNQNLDVAINGLTIGENHQAGLKDIIDILTSDEMKEKIKGLNQNVDELFKTIDNLELKYKEVEEETGLDSTNITVKLNQMIGLSSKLNNITGISENTEGKLKLIIKTKGI
jgi:putative membrane protein